MKTLQQILGHASAAMTLDVYAGLFDDSIDRLADRLDQAYAQSNAASMRPGAPSNVVSLRTASD